ncbi:uncharacterized protein LOC143881643 [Tasmannia lanceolata]|uniref:uncharacterized protein LOC143881643 n=1 Tax=Tasmannia lanceolata TaxID=3420 RepID=UPI004062D6DA
MPEMTRRSVKADVNKRAWTPDEDRKLSQCIKHHGEKRWRLVPIKAGLDRCGKSCRLRWLNYLRPNIKRGNFSDQEEDLMIRLHKLLGNRWSLIARRLPGRTDNEVKNYWNSHLSKRMNKQREKPSGNSTQELKANGSNGLDEGNSKVTEKSPLNKAGDPKPEFNVNEFFEFSEDETGGPLFLSSCEEKHKGRLDELVSKEGPSLRVEWVRELLELDECLCGFQGAGGEEEYRNLVSLT